MKHKLHTCSCSRAGCPFCYDHMELCIICSGVDHTLTTECCGHTLTREEAAGIERGRALDFINGEWVWEEPPETP